MEMEDSIVLPHVQKQRGQGFTAVAWKVCFSSRCLLGAESSTAGVFLYQPL